MVGSMWRKDFKRDWVVEKVSFLSVGGLLVLINSVLSSLPMFILSFFEIPRVVLKRLDFYRSRFFGKARSIRGSIDLLNGVWFVLQKIKGVEYFESRRSQ